MPQSFLLLVYLLLAAMAMGSWALYIGLVVVSNFTAITSRFLVLRVSITAFGMVAYAMFAFASFNVATSDGSGGLITQSYPTLAFFGIAGAVATSLFFIDSVLKVLSDEMPTGDTDPMEAV